MRDYFGMGYKQKHEIGNRKLGRSMLDHMGWIQARKFSQPLVKDVDPCYFTVGFGIFLYHFCIFLLMLKVF